MSTLLTTDYFVCRIVIYRVNKWTAHLPCTNRVISSAQFAHSFWTDAFRSCGVTVWWQKQWNSHWNSWSLLGQCRSFPFSGEEHAEAVSSPSQEMLSKNFALGFISPFTHIGIWDYVSKKQHFHCMWFAQTGKAFYQFVFYFFLLQDKYMAEHSNTEN